MFNMDLVVYEIVKVELVAAFLGVQVHAFAVVCYVVFGKSILHSRLEQYAPIIAC